MTRECVTHHICDCQHEELARLRAEVEALRRDAERYRWLRDNARRIDFAGLSMADMGQLNGRIDAALAKGRLPDFCTGDGE